MTDKHSSFVADPFIWPMPDGKVRGGSNNCMCWQFGSVSMADGKVWDAVRSDSPFSPALKPCRPPTPQTVYMFFETKSLHNMQGDIGAAVSQDGGLTFKHVGVVLDEPWHLSYPFLLEDKGKVRVRM